MDIKTDTLIIGAGQAGLLTSQALSKRGIDHLLLEKETVAHKWKTARWDSLLLQQPNWISHLPDFPYVPALTDPDGFPTATQMYDFLVSFADKIEAPVRCGIAVEGLRHDGPEATFIADTSQGAFHANSVVIATGSLQVPRRPNFLSGRTDILQISASEYRNPGQLSGGAILVVGGGNSGCQIAEDLRRAGREVVLSLDRHRRVPRRYRGKDLFWWFRESGVLNTPAEEMPVDTSPLVFAGGGNTIDMRRFAQDGIYVTGSLAGLEGDTLVFNDDLGAILDHGDRHYHGLLDRFDLLAQKRGPHLPDDAGARYSWPDSPCITEPIRRIDLGDAQINSVIWATGYRTDYSWVELPVFTPEGKPHHHHGVTDIPGLYFIGLPWQVNLSSGFIFGVRNDADMLASVIAARAADSGAFRASGRKS